MSSSTSLNSDSTVDTHAADDYGLTIAVNQNMFASFGLSHSQQYSSAGEEVRWEFVFSTTAVRYNPDAASGLPVHVWRNVRERQYEVNTEDRFYSLTITYAVWLPDSKVLLKTREDRADSMDPIPELFEWITPHTITHLKGQSQDAIYRGIAIEAFRDLYLSNCPTPIQDYGASGVEFLQGEVRYYWEDMLGADRRVIIEVVS